MVQQFAAVLLYSVNKRAKQVWMRKGNAINKGGRFFKILSTLTSRLAITSLTDINVLQCCRLLFL